MLARLMRCFIDNKSPNVFFAGWDLRYFFLVVPSGKDHVSDIKEKQRLQFTNFLKNRKNQFVNILNIEELQIGLVKENTSIFYKETKKIPS